MQHRGCLQVAMDAVSGRRRSGQGSLGTVPGLKLIALLLHLLIVVGAAPRPDCVTVNATGFRGEPAVSCANMVETKLDFNLTLSHSNVTGQVLAIGMIVIIVLLGSGIAVGYVCKRGHDLKKQQEQRACEREIQRIMLPLSAFSNPGCELQDELTVVMVSPHIQTGENEVGDGSLAASTPGA